MSALACPCCGELPCKIETACREDMRRKWRNHGKDREGMLAQSDPPLARTELGAKTSRPERGAAMIKPVVVATIQVPPIGYAPFIPPGQPALEFECRDCGYMWVSTSSARVERHMDDCPSCGQTGRLAT